MQLSALNRSSNTPQPSPAEAFMMTSGTVDRVDLNVYIGGYLAANDCDFMRSAGITHTVQMFPYSAGDGIREHPHVKYFVAPTIDSPDYDIRADAAAAVRFIQSAIAEGGRVLVFCRAGISRSATVVLLHLMVNRGHTLATALARLRLVRSFINPNPGFMAHLCATDARLQRLRVGDEHVDNTTLGGPDQYYIAPAPIAAADATRWRVRAQRMPEVKHDAALVLRMARGDCGHAGGQGDAYALEPPRAGCVAGPGFGPDSVRI